MNSITNTRFQRIVFSIVLMAVFYNTLLAIINASVFSLSSSMVVLSEILILSVIMLLILWSQIEKSEIREVMFISFIVVLAILISLVNQQLFIDSIRNFLIIVAFYLLGKRATESTIHKIFFVASLVVALFLLIEMFALDLYVQVLQPALYYAKTRGMEVSQYNELGVFNAALGFEGRFGFGLYDGPRTASAFLEQVSLSNFAVVLAIYLASLWDKVELKRKLFFIGLVLLILITSRSRAAFGVVSFVVIGYHLIPLLPKVSSLLIFPMAVLVTISVSFYFSTDYGYALEDSLKGRLLHTGFILSSFDLRDLFSLNISGLGRYADSGLAYLINANTLLGALVFWFFISLLFKPVNHSQLRTLFLVNFYFFAVLAVSGTSVFSIKTAALLWLLAGFVSTLSENETNALSATGKPL
ncbi:MAG: hypothetical protein U9N57_05690 [Pseudomonadota bacterium]|nr:hypothetical protein [Pseudomonadota bacterium]